MISIVIEKIKKTFDNADNFWICLFFSSFQGFGAVSVALATKALHLVEELMNDLQLEGLYQDMVN